MEDSTALFVTSFPTRTARVQGTMWNQTISQICSLTHVISVTKLLQQRPTSMRTGQENTKLTNSVLLKETIAIGKTDKLCMTINEYE